MSRSRDGYNRARVKRLWSICKHCHWCGAETVLQESGESRTMPNTATYDHIYHRSEPERKTKYGKHIGVLACAECNQRRGREAHFKTLPAWNRFLIKTKLNIPLYHLRKSYYKLYRKYSEVISTPNL